jgi:4-amino-4-deoxy-L-arabinose transferase-like glycosyltransferase
MPQKLFRVLLIASLFALEAIHLDSDPSPLKSVVDFGDEGFWNHNARCKVLFGTFVPDQLALGVLGAPLFTAVQWMVFSLFGVSFISARIISLVSLWGVMLMLYGLAARRFSCRVALLAVAMLGLSHEMLLYAKWATPIMPEMLFLTAILFFWELGRTGSRWWMAASGACLVGAALTKMTIFVFFPSLAMFLLGARFLRKDVDNPRLCTFLATAAIGGSLMVLVYLPQYERLQFLSRNLVGGNWMAPAWTTGQLLWAIPHIVFVTPFIFPGGAVLTMLASLWLLDRLLCAARKGGLCAIREISTTEFYSFCWLAGVLAFLAFSSYRPERRFAMLIIPLVVLAVSFAARMLEHRSSAGDSSSTDMIMALPSGWRLLLAVAFSLLWFRYACKALGIIKVWLARDGISVPLAAYVAALAACITVCAIFFILRKPPLTAGLLVGGFLAISLLLDGIWYANATYTIRDQSRALRGSVPGRYVTGHWSNLLALENDTIPIDCTWGATTRWGAKTTMNAWFVDQSDKLGFTVITMDALDEYPFEKGAGSDQCDMERFGPARVKHLGSIRLCPSTFGGTSSRVRGDLYSVCPRTLAAAPAP